MSDPTANNVLVETLGSSLRSGGSALDDVPALLKRVLRDEAWRYFVTRRGESVEHERFADFVKTPPTEGLGASMELIDRIVGTDDPDLLRLLREAKSLDSNEPLQRGEGSDYTAGRLADKAPDQYAAVARGEKTINAAAVAAGIRPHRISVRIDRPESVAASLRRHMSAEDLAKLAALLKEV